MEDQPDITEIAVKEVTDLKGILKKKKKKKKRKLERGCMHKDTFNMIRTTYRNNIELTNIADNKANILLSLNALMVTFLIPIVLTNLEVIVMENLFLPLITLSTTCIITIIMAAMATRPIEMGKQEVQQGDIFRKSPFFFGNYYKMKLNDYREVIERAMGDPNLVKEYIKLDLYFMGRGLGLKYSKIRNCYSVFIGGIILTVIATALAVIVK